MAVYSGIEYAAPCVEMLIHREAALAVIRG